MKRQSGFTLIELIIVIVILGILAVTAAPQFFNFGSDARTSTVRGLEGAMKSSADLVYARAAVDGIETQEGATTSQGNVDIDFGYPQANVAGIVEAASLSGNDWVGAVVTADEEFAITPRSLVDDSALTDPTADFPLASDSSTVTDTNCFVSYTEAADEDTPPIIEATVSGC